MKSILSFCFTWILCTAFIFLLYRFGVWVDSLMTVQTKLYHSIHSWGSIVLSPLFGLLITVGLLES